MAYDESWLIQRMLANPDLAIAQGSLTPVVPTTAPEKDLQGWMQRLCKQTGHLYFHVTQPKMSTAGLPDALILHPDGGPLYTWEIKRDGEQPSPAQRRWLEAFARVTRVEAATVYPKDLPRIVALLTRRSLP